MNGACLLLALLVTLGVVTAGQTAGPHVQGHVRLHPSWHMHSLSTHRYAQVQGSSSSSQGRSLQQAQPAVPNALPKLVVGRVKATVTNTYSWTIQRQSTASGVAVLADGYSRKQLGYSLTFTRTLQKTEYRLEGVAAITSQSAGSTPLLSVNIIADGKEVQAPCQGMPASRYDLPPGMVVECPFAVAWTEDPGAATVSGYIQTTFGRAPAAGSPVPYSFTSCGSASGDGNSAASCTVVENVACVSVTDGAFIINKYKDKLGQQLAGTVTRSRLFEASTIQDSTLGPPRTEPTTPTAAAVAKVPDTPPVWTPRMPDNTWWNGGHRKLLQLHRHPATTSSSSSSRHLLQSKKDQLVAVLDENFKWPYPTITGDRPPVGQDGKPARGSARQICGTRTFSFGMVFGPLLPAACGVFEVQNTAAALPVEGSGPAVTSSTYTYLQVQCPTASQEKASRTELARAQGG